MRPLRTAFTLMFAALALPTALLAQSPVAVPLNPGRPTYIRPPYTPRPVRPTPPGYRPPGYRPGNNGHYPLIIPLIIDGSVVNRYLATPGPTPRPKPAHKPTHRPNNGQDQFETHSSTDANE
jgi:hypothetical protein